MKLQTKLLLTFGVVLIVAFSFAEAIGYHQSRKQLLNEIRQDALEVRAILMATRRVYHHQFIDSGLPLNNKTLGFLPAHAMSRISENFKDWSDSGLSFNNVSDQPRNSKNRADAAELEAMAYFRANPMAKERLVPVKTPQGKTYYHFTAPIWVEEYCLECHGKPEEAPPTIRKTYDTAFDYQAGQLRGVMSIKLPARLISDELITRRFHEAWGHMIAFLVSFAFGAWLLHRWVIRRLNTLQLATDQLAEGDFSARLIDPAGDELGRVARTFNAMAEQRQQAEAKILEREARITDLLNSTAEAIFGVNPAGTCMFANDACVRMLGYKDAEELVGHNIHDMIHHSRPNGSSYPRHDCPMYDTLITGNGNHIVSEVLWRADGSSFPVEYWSYPLYREDELIGSVVTFLDISERKQAETALVQSEEKFRSVFESAVVGMIVVVGQKGLISEWNAGAQQIFGYSKDEAIGKSLTVLMPETYRASHERGLARAARNHGLVHGGVTHELAGLRKDGEEFPLELTLGSWEKDGEIYFSAIILDITERKRTERTMRRFSRALERSLNEIYIFDGDTLRFTNVNMGARENLGYSIDELRRMTPLDIKPEFTPESFEQLIAPLRKGSQEKIVFTTVHRRKDGSIYPVEVHLQLMHEELPVFVAIVLDITERQQTEKAMQRSQKMDAIGQLTGGIAHDFNNILGIILGNLELLEMQTSADDKIRKRVETIKKSAERAAKLTKQLLGVSRRKAAQTSTANLNTLITEMDSLITHSITPEVMLEQRLADDLWLTEIDTGDFEDALLNLIINARHAMPDGGQLILETSNCTLDNTYCAPYPGLVPGEYIQLAITDTGEGIPTDQLEHIFEPFFTTKEQGKGTGLGLAMVFGFVKRSKGNINVYSEQGIGTTFRIYLPRAHTEKQAPDSVTAYNEKLPGGHETILVVDDEPGLRELAQESLLALGYRVLTASDGQQALETLAREPGIDLVFSDVIMPGGINGYELAELATSGRPELRILLTSGYTEKAVSRNGQAVFAANLLSKPYNQADLAQRVRQLLDGVAPDSMAKPKRPTATPHSEPAPIEWQDDFNTGIDGIDNDHRRLLELLNQSKLAAASHNEKACGIILEQLREYASTHFRREEAVMAACEYPELENHRQVHQLLVKQIEDLHRQLKRGELTADRLEQFLGDWLRDHILHMDHAIAPYAQDRQQLVTEALKQAGPAPKQGGSS